MVSCHICGCQFKDPNTTYLIAERGEASEWRTKFRIHLKLAHDIPYTRPIEAGPKPAEVGSEKRPDPPPTQLIIP